MSAPLQPCLQLQQCRTLLSEHRLPDPPPPPQAAFLRDLVRGLCRIGKLRTLFFWRPLMDTYTLETGAPGRRYGTLTPEDPWWKPYTTKRTSLTTKIHRTRLSCGSWNPSRMATSTY